MGRKESPSGLHTVWIQIKPDSLPGLIFVQTVCKSYQQKTLADIVKSPLIMGGTKHHKPPQSTTQTTPHIKQFYFSCSHFIPINWIFLEPIRRDHNHADLLMAVL